MARSAEISLGKRLRLALQKVDGPAPPKPGLRYMLTEATYPLSPIVRRLRAPPTIQPAQDRRIVMMLPGFIASPITMRYLSEQIERAGHKAKRWKLGINAGPSPERLALLEQRLLEIRQRYDAEPVLLGWSLGGMFARELAHRHPDQIAKVITMGSPFAGNPRANNAWRLYQFVAGHPVDAPPVENRTDVKPPVETVAMWSARDGVVAPDSARGEPHQRDREVQVDCTHMGFSYQNAAVQAVLAELDRG